MTAPSHTDAGPSELSAARRASNVVEVPLSRGLVALIDEGDAARVLGFGKWYAAPMGGTTFYAKRNVWITTATSRRCVSFSIHRLITGWPYVDHINGDGLDNRRQNLRPATQATNSRNRPMPRTNTSGYKGVGWHKATGRWSARIGAFGRQIHLGLFDTVEEGARAYDIAAREYHGEFARLNFPEADQ